MMIEGFAPAKINLTLHVTGQRSDGYHFLDSFVAFVEIGDTVAAEPSETLGLRIDGPEAAAIEADPSNLVLRAARLLSPERGARIRLTKRLPVASGIGGGSSDAAATLRLLSRLWELPLPATEQALQLGADVPVCLEPRPQRLSGIGDRLAPAPALPACELLLVNPRVAVSTPQVFRALETKTNAPMPEEIPSFDTVDDLANWLGAQRNDLLAPARRLVPEIALVLDAISATSAVFSGMSGSGATCFGLFPPGTASGAEAQIREDHPDWWCASGPLMGGRAPGRQQQSEMS